MDDDSVATVSELVNLIKTGEMCLENGMFISHSTRLTMNMAVDGTIPLGESSEKSIFLGQR